jgi:MSHA biogenesis protein MshP
MKPLRGFALASAIFLLVILALLGTFMVSFSNTQHTTSALDLQGSRGYRAARAGIEWAAAKLSAAPTACPAPASLSVEGFTVSVSCSASSHDEAGTTRYIFWVTATAVAGGAPGGLGYTERVVNAFMEF